MELRCIVSMLHFLKITIRTGIVMMLKKIIM